MKNSLVVIPGTAKCYTQPILKEKKKCIHIFRIKTHIISVQPAINDYRGFIFTSSSKKYKKNPWH